MLTVLVVMACFRNCDPVYVVRYASERDCLRAAQANYGMNYKTKCVPEFKL